MRTLTLQKSEEMPNLFFFNLSFLIYIAFYLGAAYVSGWAI